MYGKEEHYNYLFHYNPHTGKWNGFPREKNNEYFNGDYKEEDGLISNEDFFIVLSATAAQERARQKEYDYM